MKRSLIIIFVLICLALGLFSDFFSWIEITSQPGHRISIISLGVGVLLVFLWISRQAIKLEKRLWVFVLGGIIIFFAFGYVMNFGGTIKHAIISDDYPRYRDTLIYVNNNKQKVILELMKPDDYQTFVRRKEIFKDLFWGVRISKSRSLQAMNGEWIEYSLDLKRCKCVRIENGYLTYIE